MKVLSSNLELYQYLLALSAELRKRNARDLSEVITHASRTSAGMSTEFLGESRIALRRVLTEEDGVLTVGERDELLDVLKQLDNALDKR
jgi:hypothetical protein